MLSQAYTCFEIDFLGANTWAQWKEGVPLDLLNALDADERAMAEAALLQRLSPRDDWPVRGLGHLRSQKALIPLRALLHQSTGTVRAAAALAIWQISGDPAMGDELVRLSHEEYTGREESGNWFTMVEVIRCLARLPYPAVLRRLEELKKSGNPVIAYNASCVLGSRSTASSADANSSTAGA